MSTITKTDLSETQQAILALITERVEADGVPPSQAEIASAFGFKGVRAAQYHLEALEQAGAIRRIPGQARGIRLCHAEVDEASAEALPPALSEDDVLRLPVLGRVAAGVPIGADAFDGDREAVRRQTVAAALLGLMSMAD